MTISLDYRLSPSWNKETQDTDLASADSSTLHYKLFLGDIEFRIDGADFSATWGWVPVLDFAGALRTIVRSLPETREGIFEFTESDAALRFVCRDDVVTVTSNYAQGRISAEVAHRELLQAAEAFLAKLVDDLYQAHPELRNNPEMEAFTG